MAALETLFYLCAIPIHLAVRLNGARVGAGFSAFEQRAARRRAEDELAAPPTPGGKAPDYRRVMGFLRRLKIERAELTGRVAMGDAAATALLCGGITGLARAFRGRVGRMKVDVRPEFGGDAPALELYGMIRARSGQIILAALQALIEEEFPWTGTRLKIS